MVSFINVLLLLMIQVSRCIIDNIDLKIVQFCPTSKEEWNSAAQKKNCSKFVTPDNFTTDEEQIEYHCLINAYLNETLEVCALKKLIFGHCTEFNVAGRVIQNHVEAKCNEIFPKCDAAYSSIDAYKYSDCYKLVYGKRNQNYTTTDLPQEKTTFVKSEHDKENGSTGITAAIITAVIIVCGLVVISVFHFIKRNKRKKANKDIDEEEGEDLMGIEADDTINKEKSTENKMKKADKEIDEEEGEDPMGIEADDTINKGKSTRNKRKKANKEIDEQEGEDLKGIEAGKSTGNKRKKANKEIDEQEEEGEDLIGIEAGKSTGNKRKKASKEIDEEEGEDLMGIEAEDSFHPTDTSDSYSSQEEDNVHLESVRKQKPRISTPSASKTSISSKQKRSRVLPPMSPCFEESDVHETPKSSGTNLSFGQENWIMNFLRSLGKKVDNLSNEVKELKEISLSRKETC